jgi:surface protein
MSAMFREASSFNQDLMAWNTPAVTNMCDMFNGATSFNQNLCSWQDNFSYNSACNIFQNSGCTYTSTPSSVTKGPFCASDCTNNR